MNLELNKQQPDEKRGRDIIVKLARGFLQHWSMLSGFVAVLLVLSLEEGAAWVCALLTP